MNNVLTKHTLAPTPFCVTFLIKFRKCNRFVPLFSPLFPVLFILNSWLLERQFLFLMLSHAPTWDWEEKRFFKTVCVSFVSFIFLFSPFFFLVLVWVIYCHDVNDLHQTFLCFTPTTTQKASSTFPSFFLSSSLCNKTKSLKIKKYSFKMLSVDWLYSCCSSTRF